MWCGRFVPQCSPPSSWSASISHSINIPLSADRLFKGLLPASTWHRRGIKSRFDKTNYCMNYGNIYPKANRGNLMKVLWCGKHGASCQLLMVVLARSQKHGSWNGINGINCHNHVWLKRIFTLRVTQTQWIHEVSLSKIKSFVVEELQLKRLRPKTNFMNEWACKYYKYAVLMFIEINS